jgi:hypothetical protein
METTATERLLPNSNASPGLKHTKLLYLFFCCLWVLASATPAFAQTPKIKITDPQVKATTDLRSQGALYLSFTVSGSDITKVRVMVFQIDVTGGVTTTLDTAKTDVDIDADKDKQSFSANLFQGLNRVQLTGLRAGKPDPKVSASITVTCSNKCRNPTTDEAEGSEQVTAPKTPKTPKTAGNISILTPSAGRVQNGLVNSVIAVKKNSIQTLLVLVTNDGKIIEQTKSKLPVKYTDDLAILTPKLRVKKGENLITFVNLDNPLDKVDQASVTVSCDGEKCDTPVATVAEAIRINIPEGGAQNRPSVLSEITIKKDSNITKVFVRVLNNGKPLEKPLVGDGETLDVQFEAGRNEAVLKPKIKIGKGTNVLTVFDAARSIDDSPQDSTEISCNDKCSGSEHTGTVVIARPRDVQLQDESFIKTKISVTKRSITKLFVRVLNKGKPVEQRQDTWAVKFEDDGKPAEVNPTVRLEEGTNEITVLADPLTDDGDQDSTSIVCKGANCGSENQVSTIVTNSLNTRVVVGLEQVGASSADSETKPFLDFFFTGPLRFSAKNAELPRLATWGQIRISTTPEQVGAVGVFPSNLINQVSQNSKTVGLVQSFDFLAGLEGRVFGSNGYVLSLIPGVRQRTEFYVIGGGGAISPLSTTQQTAQIFAVPVMDNPQRQTFIDRFGSDAVTKTYIAFVFPERDRFLRQYYGGIRLKTFYYDRDNRLINRFPAILDFMVGQNEAVTGGKLKNDVTDSSGKIIGKKRSWVLRLDGFYPLPIKEASFLYLYGTAMMKVGGGGVRINTPLFLDTAPGNVLLTSSDVFIAPNLQMNRDYYKIGVGVNLTDLFNRKKPPE